MKQIIQTLTAIGLGLASACAMAQGAAAPYPSRPLELTVPFGAGGTTDAVSRRLASLLEKELGQPVVVINKPGAQGTIQPTHLAKAKPDGYTLGVLTFAPMTYTNQLMNVAYTRDDFTYLAAFGTPSWGIVVPAESPIKNLDELVAAAKKPNGVTFSTSGAPNNIPLVRLAGMSGGRFEQVLYRSGMEAVAAVAGKHVDLTLQNPPDFAAMVKAGTLRVIASVNDRRLIDFPAVPTMREQGYDIFLSGLLGVAAPKGLPEDVREKLERAILKAANHPDYIAFIEGLHGMQSKPLDGAHYRKAIDEGYAGYSKLIKDFNIARIN